ncbi:S-adenosyl-L-methionine-dependent methyltransferase [Annulohypoxylon nitens]|nr:S-adenosyl-L-methionine-dependent methyltransferase [Annulohypoxylon nitens]
MKSTATQYEELAQQIECILQNPEAPDVSIPDEQIRRRLADGGRKLSILLEEPRHTMSRLEHVHFQLPLAIIGADTGLFAALAAEPRPSTSTELSQKTGVTLSLLKRLLRYYQALDMIFQVGNDAYQSNNITRVLSNEDHADALRFAHKIMGPPVVSLPGLLQSTGYKDPTGVMPTALAKAHNTEKHAYSWLGENPWALKLTLAYMKVQFEGRPLFFDVLDFQARFGTDSTSSTVLFVDIGGSTGSQSLNFRRRYPSLPGRVIIQDRPEVVQKAKSVLDSAANIELEAYDIFTPQPIKGARAYYMRKILHSFADEKCLKILANLKAGLTEQSVIMIDETVLPEQGARPRGAQHDIEVLMSVGAKERTKPEWEQLLNEAGLNLREMLTYDEEYDECLIIAGP